MYLAKVIGSIVSTKKHDSLVGKKIMIVQPIDSAGESIKAVEVACDHVGAGIGEMVLITKGHAARMIFEPEKNVIDTAIVAIIDSVSK